MPHVPEDQYATSRDLFFNSYAFFKYAVPQVIWESLGIKFDYHRVSTYPLTFGGVWDMGSIRPSLTGSYKTRQSENKHRVYSEGILVESGYVECSDVPNDDLRNSMYQKLPDSIHSGMYLLEKLRPSGVMGIRRTFNTRDFVDHRKYWVSKKGFVNIITFYASPKSVTKGMMLRGIVNSNFFIIKLQIRFMRIREENVEFLTSGNHLLTYLTNGEYYSTDPNTNFLGVVPKKYLRDSGIEIGVKGKKIDYTKLSHNLSKYYNDNNRPHMAIINDTALYLDTLYKVTELI